MDAFAAKVKKENRGQNYLDAAGRARILSADFQSFVDSLDNMLVEAVGTDTTTGSLKKPDDQDTPTRLFVEKEKLGFALEEKVNATRSAMLGLLDANDRKAMDASISLAIDSIPANSPQERLAYLYILPNARRRCAHTFVEIQKRCRIKRSRYGRFLV